MTGAAQHGHHPDAEQLNAFAEQALSEVERGEVLGHLAACSRCRQVVALAREAAEQEGYEHVAAAAAPRPALQPNGWWRRWRVIWVPAAAATAVAVTSLSIYLRQAEQQRGAAIRIAEQPQNRAAAPASAAPPAEIAEAAPPAPPVSAAPAPEKHSARHPGAPLSSRRLYRSPVDVDTLPPIEGAPAAQSPLPAENAAPALADARFLAAGKPGIYPSSAAVEGLLEKKKQALETQQAQAGAIGGELFAPGGAPAVKEQRTGGSVTRLASDQAAVTTEQTALRPAATASFGALGKLKADLIPTVRTLSPFQLPSGLRTISFASSGERQVALDEVDALFVSADSGKTWESVPRQWTGSPVMVRRAPASRMQPEPLAAQSDGSEAAGTEPAPATGFELVNDEGQIWLSVDGKVWKAK